MQDLRVHGSIFFLLKKFINNNHPDNNWELLNKKAGTDHINFTVTENYSISVMNQLVHHASVMTGTGENELMEQFGQYLVNDLFALYASYIRPEWRTYDIILNTEPVMHGAVRKLNSTANPPILHVTKVHDKVLMIDYHSRRKMAPLAIGIIKGIAEYYNETDSITITPMSDPGDERVQIRLDFK